MHAEIRRVPAERARHAKRLGHVRVGSGAPFLVLAGAGNGNGTTTTIQQGATASSTGQTAPTTTASATHSSSSSALSTSSSTTPTTLSASSSAVTPSTSDVAFSAGAQSLTASVLSSSFLTPPAVLTSTFPTSSSASTPHTNTTPATNSGLSGGAIAGIIAGAVIVGTALIVFFVRKTYLRRRERKHISWTGASGLGAGILDEPKLFPDVSERPASFTTATKTPQEIVPPSPFEAHGQPMYPTPVSPLACIQPTTTSIYAVPIPPSATYNNPTPVAAYPPYPVASAYYSGNPPGLVTPRGITGTGISSTLSSVRAQHTPMEAIVKCTFVPTLPDELSITTGERIFINEQYDDGWNLCTNIRGERGMVPRDCLEHASLDQPSFGWRNVGRASSLIPDGKRS